MTQKTMINGESMSPLLETTLVVEQFLNENYCFRRNVLNGKVEFATKSDSLTWRPLTQEAINSIIRRAKKEQVCEKGVRRRKSWSLFTLRMYLCISCWRLLETTAPMGW